MSNQFKTKVFMTIFLLVIYALPERYSIIKVITMLLYIVLLFKSELVNFFQKVKKRVGKTKK